MLPDNVELYVVVYVNCSISLSDFWERVGAAENCPSSSSYIPETHVTAKIRPKPQGS